MLFSVLITDIDLYLSDSGGNGRLIGGIHPHAQQGKTYRPVHGSRIQMQNAQPLRNRIRNTGFSCSNRAVYCYVNRHFLIPSVVLLVVRHPGILQRI